MTENSAREMYTNFAARTSLYIGGIGSKIGIQARGL